jgi:hypothetical protein
VAKVPTIVTIGKATQDVFLRSSDAFTELELGWNDKVGKDFSYFAKFNFSTSENRVVFKDDPNRYVITHVTFKLLKKEDLKISYGDLKQAVGDELTAFNLQQQVIQIRQSKLPDPKEFPNVGSFLKIQLLVSKLMTF